MKSAIIVLVIAVMVYMTGVTYAFMTKDIYLEIWFAVFAIIFSILLAAFSIVYKLKQK